MIVMSGFPIDKCQVVWKKEATSDTERKAILHELSQMAVELQEAIDFTVKLSNRKPNEVKYWLGANTETDFTISIYFDQHAQAWGMLIERMATETAAPQV